jgi:PAS domain S-box-containing protein
MAAREPRAARALDAGVGALAALAQRLADEPHRALQHVLAAAVELLDADAAAIAAPDAVGELRWRAVSGAYAANAGVVLDQPVGACEPSAHALAFVLQRSGATVGRLWLGYVTPVPRVDADLLDALAAFATLALPSVPQPVDAVHDALRHSEQRFEKFMEQLPGLAWIKDLDGRYVFVNEAAERAFRMSREQLQGRTDEELFDGDTAAQFLANDRKVLATGVGVQTIEMLEQADGVHHSLVH